MSYERITDLDDPERLWRIVYKAGAHFVKVHVKRQSRGFGIVSWSISGSLCDGGGKALLDAEDAPMVLAPGLQHEVTVHSETPVDIDAAKEEGVRVIIARVVQAAEHLTQI